ncbi:MAG: hypothetical protein JW733_02290 [Coriobacteriia bacterium]|nr:hypothetical protein [Coriobacteriia bacterium]MBN2840473.1 hypothetical protein [Coriobacteriia bacterium]
MHWQSIPALVAAGLMVVIGLGAMVRPSTLEMVGISTSTPLGRSEVRAVFGGMFVALGMACMLTREPIVFAVVGAAWLTDVAVRIVAIFIDRVPAREALAVLAIGGAMGAALLSGYWFA